MIKLIRDNVCTVRAMRMASGIAMMIFLLAGVAGASTPITGCTDIYKPGIYVLTKNIINSSATVCININSSNVVLDGNGFTIDGVGGVGSEGVQVYNLTGLTNVTIRNLNVTDWYSGIYYRKAGIGTIRGNNASNNYYGIDLWDSSNNILSGNNATNNQIGIRLGGNNNTLSGNNATNNQIGISLDGNNNTLSGNNATNNQNGISLGGNNNMLSGNNASNNQNGISLGGNNNMLSGNNANSNSQNGISLSGSNNNIMSGNNANSNNYNGIYLFSSSNNTLNGNNANSNNYNGIYLYYINNNNTLSGNNANSNNRHGIFLELSSNNNILSGNNINSNNVYGINLDSSSNNTLSGNNALNNFYGINLDSSSNNTLTGNNANSNNRYGIYLFSASNNTLTGNNASNNLDGIYLVYISNNNTLSGNNANSNNNYGIYLEYSSNNKLTNNVMIENSYNFYLYGGSVSAFDNQIDTSNIVDGKNIYYIKGAKNAVYDFTNAGTFYCISCINVTIKDMNLNKNGAGIVFWNTTRSIIQNVNVTNNNYGINLDSSSNNTLSRNTVNLNYFYGIYLSSSSNNNTLTGNNASINIYYGIYIDSSSNNLIYDNIFNNTHNFVSGSNIWNTTWTPGTNIIGGPYIGGNFWATPGGSGFSQTCQDIDSDGICDSSYILDSNNIDYLPLANDIKGISSCTAISSPGSYVLIQNITGSMAASCITITSSNVVFDGAGYTIDGVDALYAYGVYVDPIAINVTVKNLTVTDWYYGIYLHYSRNNTLSGNHARSNSYGILMDHSTNNTLDSNTAILNRYDGIYLFSSGNNILSNNTAMSNPGNGIFVYSFSENNMLINNKVSGSSYGIGVYTYGNKNILKDNNISNNIIGITLSTSSNYNTLSGNTVVNSSNYGIYLWNSSINTLYNNYFNNTNNAWDNGYNNWNTTKSGGKNIIGGPYLGGNFWAHPNGTGFSQTCLDIDRDGICDSSYVLDANNTDYLPLSMNYTLHPAIVIYTDNTSYKAGDKMYVGLNITNPGSAVKAGIYIWVDLPGGGKKDVKSYPSVTLPAGMDWKIYPWMTVTLPVIPSGNYAWHAILKNTSSGNIISESISPWTFGSTAEGGTGSLEAMNKAMQEVPVEMDFTNEPE